MSRSSAIIDRSAERHGTYPEHTVVAGMSNGAFMARRMALEVSDKVAVLAAVAGGLPASLRDRVPARFAVPLLTAAGTRRL
jgi:polyhydroxybutyrate depolymerase